MSKVFFSTAIAVALAFCASGCAARQAKTAPCKRPAELTSYSVDPRFDCGAMRLVNPRDLTAQGAARLSDEGKYDTDG